MRIDANLVLDVFQVRVEEDPTCETDGEVPEIRSSRGRFQFQYFNFLVLLLFDIIWLLFLVDLVMYMCRLICVWELGIVDGSYCPNSAPIHCRI